MQRIVRLFCDQLMGAHAHQHIGGLDADDQILIAHILNQMHLVQSALHQSLGGHTVIFFHQILFQGTAVDAHADGDIPLLCRIHHGTYPVNGSDVSGIDADLVRPVLHGRDGQAVVKMNVRHKGDRNLCLDLPQRLCRLHGGHRHPDDLASGLLQFKDLSHCSRHILCFCIAHGLDRDGV